MARHGFVRTLEAAAHHLGAGLQRELPDLDLDQAQLHILGLLGESGPLTVGDIHARFGHRPSTVTAVVDRLERQGLVTRVLNPRDRRSLIVGLTERGEAAYAQLDEALARLELDLSRRIGAAAFAALAAQLRDLEASLVADAEPGSDATRR